MPILSGGPLYRDKTNTIEDYPSSLGETFAAGFDRAVDTGLSELAGGALRIARGDIGGIQEIGRPFGVDAAAEVDPSSRVYAADARKRAEASGVKLVISDEAYFSPGELDTVIALKKRERAQLQTLGRRPQTWGGFAAEMGGGLAGSMTDPVQVAASFIPVVGQARYARFLAGASGMGERAAIRAGVGAVEGLAGAALLEPLIYSRAQSIGLEYTSTDSFMNLAFGTVMGGGLHVAGGAAFDAVTGRANDAPRFDPPEPLSRSALQQAVIASDSGAGFNVKPMFDEQAARDAVGEIGRFRRQLDRVAAEEDAALGAAFRADRSGVKAKASGRIAALEAEIAALDRDISVARQTADTAIDDVTPSRLGAISRELEGNISTKRRAELEAERRLLTEGAASTPTDDALAKGRALAEAEGLEKARARAEKDLKAEQERLAKADAVEAKGDKRLATEGARVASRQDDVRRLTARAVRRWAATVGEQIDTARADDIAARLMGAPLDGFDALARQELSALATKGGLNNADVKPDVFDPATGYEPPEMERVRIEADEAAMAATDDIDGEIEALGEMVAMAEKRGPMTDFDRSALDLADAFETNARRTADSYRAAAACISGVA